MPHVGLHAFREKVILQPAMAETEICPMSYSDVPRVYPQRKEARQWSPTLYRRVETNRDKKMPRQITALELFSGVGGEAIALKEAGVKTIGYCEIKQGERCHFAQQHEARQTGQGADLP